MRSEVSFILECAEEWRVISDAPVTSRSERAFLGKRCAHSITAERNPFAQRPPLLHAAAVKRAIYAGSFDPITNGHLDVLTRAAKVFDQVVLAVAVNSEKTGLFSTEERVALLKETVATLTNVRVTHFNGLLVEFARIEKASAIIRGLRAVSDFELEFQMALMNRRLEPALETLFLMPKEEYSYVSSRLVKEVARLGGNVADFVPPCVERALRAKFFR